ncbi:hypothetical protein ACFLTN_04010 [Chloroflexota bacterium]
MVAFSEDAVITFFGDAELFSSRYIVNAEISPGNIYFGMALIPGLMSESN